jgi:hypothetical protein
VFTWIATYIYDNICWILLRMKNVSHKNCRQNRNIFYFYFFFFENRAVYKNVEKYGTARQVTDDNIIRSRKETIYMLGNKGKNTNIHSEYVILFTFLLQQWLHERAWMLGYAYIACLVYNQHTSTKWQLPTPELGQPQCCQLLQINTECKWKWSPLSSHYLARGLPGHAIRVPRHWTVQALHSSADTLTVRTRTAWQHVSRTRTRTSESRTLRSPLSM